MIWASVWGFMKKIPDWAWWLFLAIAAGLFIDLRARSEQRAKDKAAQDIETRKTIDRIEERSNEHVEQADRIRAANPVSPDDPGMSDTPLPDYHYRDRPPRNG